MTARHIRYATGEIVRVGDIVDAGFGGPGIVEAVLQAGTKFADDYACPDGGVLIIGLISTGEPLVAYPIGNSAWDEVELIRRAVPDA